jgi:decaprenyl-phosphate phosphoribosyltransferase
MKGSFKTYFLVLRTHQWVKNLLVLAPPYFGDVLFSNLDIFLMMTQAFIAFSFASSTVYIINDIFDKQEDIAHPTKKFRPIASDTLDNRSALILACLTFIISIVLSLSFDKSFIFFLIVYLFLNIAYSLFLQYIVFVDAFSIAIGFVLRVEAGGAASSVNVSSWLIIMTVILSLLLAFGKRRFELGSQEEENKFREVLARYKAMHLDQILVFLGIAAIVSYSLYSFSRGTWGFLMTIPFVCFGVIRYLYLVKTLRMGDPTESFFNDKWLLVCVLIWFLITFIIIYI